MLFVSSPPDHGTGTSISEHLPQKLFLPIEDLKGFLGRSQLFIGKILQDAPIPKILHKVV